ncbi:MAG: glycosyltransferase family 4 protein [Limnospira sp.]
MTKLKVLLVPDYLDWILGTWAKQIVRVGTRHDYYFFPQQMFPHYQKEWDSLIERVDVIHVLNDFAFEKTKFPDSLPAVGSIHHVTDWEPLIPITQKCDRIMTVAGEWRDFLLEKGIPGDRISLFHNGVDTSVFYPLPDKMEARRKLGISSPMPLIGYSAKFTSNTDGRKGIPILLKALKRLSETDLKFGIVITSPGWDEVVKEIKSYGISEVYYYPFLPDRMMPVCYNALDLYVVTSQVEGGPVPVINCLACGVPVVTTPVGIVIDYIRDGANGMVVPKEDAEATAKAIARLLENPELRNNIAKNGLETVANHLTWDKTLSGIEEMYERVWAEKSSRREPSKAAPDPIKQREKILAIDAYLWNVKLLKQGHTREGIRGILEGNLGIASTETLKITFQKLSGLFDER